MKRVITVIVKGGGSAPMTLHEVAAHQGLPLMSPEQLKGWTIAAAIACNHGNIMMELEKED